MAGAFHDDLDYEACFERGIEALDVTSEGIVEVTETHGVLGPHTGPAPIWLFKTVTPRTKAGAGVKASGAVPAAGVRNHYGKRYRSL